MASPVCTTLPSYASGTNADSATFNGSAQDCRTCISARFTGTMTNGGTAPNTPAQVNLQISEDNSTWYTAAIATGTLTGSASTLFDFYRPYPGSWVRLQVTGNTGQSVTYAAVGNLITAVS